MATKSIYKNIKIKDRYMCRNLVSALENAHAKRSAPVDFQRSVSDVRGEDIKKLFGDFK